jgi:hypothetical protein
MGSDPERIYLEPGEGATETGRLWCEDDVWDGDPDYADDPPATEYVRADLCPPKQDAGPEEDPGPKELYARRALLSLYAQVPSEVAEDVTKIVTEAFDEIRARTQREIELVEEEWTGDMVHRLEMDWWALPQTRPRLWDYMAERINEARTQREVTREATELHHVRMQRDGLRNILGSVYRRLRDGREVLPSQMEALRICYDRRRSLDGLTITHGPDPDGE